MSPPVTPKRISSLEDILPLLSVSGQQELSALKLKQSSASTHDLPKESDVYLEEKLAFINLELEYLEAMRTELLKSREDGLIPRADLNDAISLADQVNKSVQRKWLVLKRQ